MKARAVREHPLMNQDGAQGRSVGGFGAGAATMMIDAQQYEQE